MPWTIEEQEKAIDIIPSPLKYRDSRNLYYKVLYLYPAGRDEDNNNSNLGK